MIDHEIRHLMMKVFVLLLMSFGTDVKAQVVTGARNLGLANASVALPGIHSIGHNAAGIAYLKRPVIRALYGEHFAGSSTHSLAGKAALPTSFASFGLQFHHYSFDSHFQETTAGLAIAKSLSSQLALGFSANYHFQNAADLVQLSRLSFDVGAQYVISEFAFLGLSLKNIQGIFEDDEVVQDKPGILSLGSTYHFSSQVLLATELAFLLKNRTDFAIGLEYLPIPWLFLRGGLSVNPFIQYVGAGFKHKDIAIDLATSFHPKLGYSPQVSIDYRF